MRLDDQRESRNIENRRGQRPAGGGLGGGMGGGGMGLIGAFLPFILSKFGIGGLLVLGAIFLAFQFLGSPGGQMVAPQQGSPAAPGAGAPAKVRPADQFVSKVLATTEDTWGQIFAERGARYPEPILVFFEGAVASACGNASSASGPFYCPADRRVYLDTAFFDQLARQFGAPGEFTAAYVIAHEVGHHVQNVTGVLGQVQQIQQRAGKVEQNQLQVRVELQADCYAGVWASAGRRVVPDAFTHGTAEQRVRWLTTGFRAGNPDACDTFKLPYGQL
ncbi:MAG: neutral zinc metallopeptidase [Sphingomonadaceae bacterium]